MQFVYTSSDPTLGVESTPLVVTGHLNVIILDDDIVSISDDDNTLLNPNRYFLHHAPSTGEEEILPKVDSTSKKPAVYLRTINSQEPRMSRHRRWDSIITFDDPASPLGYHPPQTLPAEIGFYCLPLINIWEYSHQVGRYGKRMVSSERHGLMLQLVDEERQIFRRIGLVMETLEKSDALGPTISQESNGSCQEKHEAEIRNEQRRDLDKQWQQSNMFLSNNGPNRVITII